VKLYSIRTETRELVMLVCCRELISNGSPEGDGMKRWALDLGERIVEVRVPEDYAVDEYS
jgi:hypothetical protein